MLIFFFVLVADFYLLLLLSPGCLESKFQSWIPLLSFEYSVPVVPVPFCRSCHCRTMGVFSAENSLLYNWSRI